MPALDTDHESVKRALVKDGWTITHDPYTIEAGEDKVYANLRCRTADCGREDVHVPLTLFAPGEDRIVRWIP